MRRCWQIAGMVLTAGLGCRCRHSALGFCRSGVLGRGSSSSRILQQRAITRLHSAQSAAATAATNGHTQSSPDKRFDFDTLPDRSNQGALKWDKYAGRDIIPMWVADMDFQLCPAIAQALQAHVISSTYGYTLPTPGAIEAVTRYLTGLGISVADKDELVFMPGVVQGLNLVCKLIPEDASVMVFSPIYPPFTTAPDYTGRGLVTIPLIRAPVETSPDIHTEQWTFDFPAMEAAVSKQNSNVKLLILCNPSNPVGRIFTEKELHEIGEFCAKYDILICSDEIHCDLVLEENVRFTPMAAVSGGAYADRTITMNAPSKTYNVPGLGCSYAHIQNKVLRKQFAHVSRGIITQNPTLGYVGVQAAYSPEDITQNSTLGYVGVQAAYSPEGLAWRAALIEYLRANRDLVYSYISEHMPELIMYPMQSTYLAWIDVSALEWRDPVLQFECAGVGFTDGRFFGDRQVAQLESLQLGQTGIVVAVGEDILYMYPYTSEYAKSRSRGQ